MAVSETHGRYFFIGGIVLLLIIMIILVVLWFHFRREFNKCETSESKTCLQHMCSNGLPAIRNTNPGDPTKGECENST